MKISKVFNCTTYYTFLWVFKKITPEEIKIAAETTNISPICWQNQCAGEMWSQNEDKTIEIITIMMFFVNLLMFCAISVDIVGCGYWRLQHKIITSMNISASFILTRRNINLSRWGGRVLRSPPSSDLFGNSWFRKLKQNYQRLAILIILIFIFNH